MLAVVRRSLRAVVHWVTGTVSQFTMGESARGSELQATVQWPETATDRDA